MGLLFTVIKMLQTLGAPEEVFHVVSALTHAVLPHCYEGPISEFRVHALVFHELAGLQFPALTLVLGDVLRVTDGVTLGSTHDVSVMEPAPPATPPAPPPTYVTAPAPMNGQLPLMNDAPPPPVAP